MFQVQLEDLILTVDEETAVALKDPEVAKNYVKQVKEQLNKDSVGDTTTVRSNKDSVGDTTTVRSMVWTTSKKVTRRDNEATLEFLKLRFEYDEDFKDKKTVNNDIWQKIAMSMNRKGFFVGEGIEGREKCRQKFSNLQQSYLKYIDRRKRTGEGAIPKPPYYEDLHRILGDKHKAVPAVVMDSLDETESDAQLLSTEPPKPSTSQGNIPMSDLTNNSSLNRFTSVKKSLRPKSQKSSTLEELLKIQKENQTVRQNEFQALMNMFHEQNSQRHEQMMALIKGLRSAKGKKRKLETSDSSDDSN